MKDPEKVPALLASENAGVKFDKHTPAAVRILVGGVIGILGGICAQYGTGPSFLDLVIGAAIGAVLCALLGLIFPKFLNWLLSFWGP